MLLLRTPAHATERSVSQFECTYIYRDGLEKRITYVFEFIPLYEASEDFQWTLACYPTDRLDKRYKYHFDQMSLKTFIKLNEWEISTDRKIDLAVLSNIYGEMLKHFQNAVFEEHKYVYSLLFT